MEKISTSESASSPLSSNLGCNEPMRSPSIQVQGVETVLIKDFQKNVAVPYFKAIFHV